MKICIFRLRMYISSLEIEHIPFGLVNCNASSLSAEGTRFCVSRDRCRKNKHDIVVFRHVKSVLLRLKGPFCFFYRKIMANYTFEICANSAESCVAAQQGGAQRVELCASMPEGGTTPSYGEIRMARKLIDIRLHVIVRPRGGDFLYSPMELDIMEEDIRMAREAGADGVVFGCLTPEGDVDREAMQKLLKVSEGLSVTFHRAFDYVRNPESVLEELVEMGVDRVLTSGQQPTALQGADLLRKLVKRAANRIIVMPGCGVNETNIAELATRTGAEEFHFSARENRQSRMLLRNPALSMGGTVSVDEYSHPVTTPERVRNTIRALTGRG